MVATQERRRQPRRATLLAGLGLVSIGSLALGLGSEAWAAPATSRRSAAAAGAAAFFGALPQAALAQEREAFIKAGPAGDANPELDVSQFKLPADVVAKNLADREKEALRQERLKEEFRGIFTEFAQAGQTLDRRLELMEQMGSMTLKEKMLPLGITREDVVKGVRAVKFNEGCIKGAVKKGDCKTLEKGYMKLLANIDKVYDQSLVTAR
eukprot:TRINITY_DN23785_c0_g1_i2.p1 TRINITY_DN23785_c0_g1~~TRINITY_DN23785_c0_g1_i2.p1  ORF type:complete len:235 (+),score=71.12 TRINITY_DN23785_c0_g1_i2:76-705(+)